jgi:hypothetical protein
MESLIEAGARVQRFWLQATSVGLQLQPSYTPIAFHAWASSGDRFSTEPWVAKALESLSRRWRDVVGVDADRAVFAMRLGFGKPPRSRSGRLSLTRLMERNAS